MYVSTHFAALKLKQQGFVCFVFISNMVDMDFAHTDRLGSLNKQCRIILVLCGLLIPHKICFFLTPLNYSCLTQILLTAYFLFVAKIM